MKRFTILLTISFCAAAIHSDAAFRFGLANSAAKRATKIVDEKLPTNPILILPVAVAQMTTSGQVIWPFGIRAGGHPEGHPGIDFQTILGASVFASAAGKVREVSDRSGTSLEAEKVIIIDHALYQGAYVGSLINISVAVGDFVVQGQKLGDLGPFALGPGTYGFLHWGYTPFSTQSPVCPYNFLTAQGKKDLEQLFALSTYDGQNQFPLLCNPCPVSGCR